MSPRVREDSALEVGMESKRMGVLFFGVGNSFIHSFVWVLVMEHM